MKGRPLERFVHSTTAESDECSRLPTLDLRTDPETESIDVLRIPEGDAFEVLHIELLRCKTPSFPVTA